MQMSGLMHGVVHIQHPPSDGAGQAAAPLAEEQVANTWGNLFNSHESQDEQCKLFDVVAHADCLPTAAALWLTQPLPLLASVVHASWHLAAQSAGYLARGPPSRA